MSSTNSRGGFVAVAVIVLCIAAYLPCFNQRFGDFRAFYCSGRAVLARADPYREHPLRECEHQAAAPGISALPDDAAIPAPFPGYVLALFAALATLPFGAAAALWLSGSIAALTAACVLFARCVRAPIQVLAILVGFPAVTSALSLGQLTPFVALAISATAFLLVLGKPRSAAIAALGIAIEPHVAAAVFVALFIGERKTRIPLVLGCLTLAVSSLIVVGLSGNIEYFRDVLPGHALANLTDVEQFSATHVAALTGLKPSVARTIGSLWYVGAAIVGISVAVRLAPRFGVQALVLVPIAFEVFGGVYVHMAQLAFAIPAFLLVLPRTGAARSAALIAVFFAAMPWNMIVNYPMLVPALAVLAIALCVSLDTPQPAALLATSAALTSLVFFYTGVLSLSAVVSEAGAFHPAGNPLADDSWRHWMEWLAAHRRPTALIWSQAVKIPTILAFVSLLGLLGARCLPRPPLRVEL